ncbi:hypothetical protein RI662_03560 [Brevibacillus agri]|uniref:hypothetical protein n=1 Tax=Brevibacillus agri TaxID=51101 RepID=UPI0028702562|nr:hypothetical protein [Brevibacillus agri]MDR9503378.1 hypothetical protein [Brevibacillus agri]
MTKMMRIKKRAATTGELIEKSAKALMHKGFSAFFICAAILSRLKRDQKAARRFNEALMSVIRR